jgi:hypothetical protein
MVKRASSGYRPANVDYAQTRKLMFLRYPDGQINNDTLGRNRLRRLVDQLVRKTDNFLETLRIASRWAAPSMSEEEICSLVTGAVNARKYWGQFEIGNLFDLTAEERALHKITIAWPRGFTPQDAIKHRKALRNKYEKNRRRRISAEQREASRAAYDEPCLSDHQKAVYAQTSLTWKLSSEIEKELSTWPMFKHHNSVALRQVISRALRALEKLGLVERDDTQKGSRKQPLVYVRRPKAPPFSGCPRPDVTVTTVTSRNYSSELQDAE